MRMSQSCVTYALPVCSLPLGAGLQTAQLGAVRPQRGVTAVGCRAVYQTLPHAFATAAGALTRTQGFEKGICFLLAAV